MSAYTAELYNPDNELDSLATDNDTEQPGALERLIQWCTTSLEAHNNSPWYTPGWTAQIKDDATSERVWPEPA